MSPRSTSEIARLVGIGPATLERWLAQDKVPMPKRVRVGTRLFRLWSGKDIERVKRYKEKFYRKGRGRKKRKR